MITILLETNSQIGEMHRARSALGGEWGAYFCALSLWGQGVSPSQHISVYTNREAVPRLRVQSSYGGVITWA